MARRAENIENLRKLRNEDTVERWSEIRRIKLGHLNISVIKMNVST